MAPVVPIRIAVNVDPTKAAMISTMAGCVVDPP
jgi:hypothetical protein